MRARTGDKTWQRARRWLCATFWVSACLTPAFAADATENAAAVRRSDLERHVSFLASDTLEGREAGSRGGAAACQYIIGELKKFGLQPAGEDGRFTQDVVPRYRNILALLPPEGPDATDDVILIGAHYDHVGYGRSTNSQGPLGYIHNGADDNASGVSAVLEIAQFLAASDTPRRCAVLFAFWDAEEINLNGSEYWCAHPTVPLTRIRLAINVDMVGRLNGFADVRGARTAPGLRARIARANAVSDVTMKFHDDHQRNSDHYSFMQRRIPYLMIDTREHEDYHRPSDDIDKLNFDGLERMTNLLLNVTSTSAQQSTAPFRKDCLHESRRTRPLQTVGQRFGISWKTRTADEPVVITEVVAGSAAARAGITVGDRLVRFADRAPGSTAELRDAVAGAVGPVAVVVERDGSSEPLTLEVRLDGQPQSWGIATAIDAAEPDVLSVTSVTPGSPAAAAEIKPGDRILEQQLVEPGLSGGDVAVLSRQARVQIERDGRVSWRTIATP